MSDKALVFLVMLVTLAGSSLYLWENRGDLTDPSVAVYWKAVYVCAIFYVAGVVLTLLMLLVIGILI
jgi:hypothetical protein